MISYRDFAQTVLLGHSLEDKLLCEAVDWGEWKEASLPTLPGRCARLRFSDKREKFPKEPHLSEPRMKARALHSFANHELLAIEMMAAALLIYPHGDEDSIRFKKGILGALRDEQKHLQLYVKRINDLGFEFGDFSLNDYFWRQMPKLRTPAQYAAVMALTFEAANLDFAGYYARVFRSLGDAVTADILDTVLEDEVSHVAFGAHWMKRWRRDKDLWAYYLECLPHPMTPARARGLEFNFEVHERAMGDLGFVENLKNYDDDFPVTKRARG